ncbi:DNA-binding NtrC family response regulator [Bradyrhizobium sp. GM22.5]
MRHGSIIESPNREAQTGTEDLRHILVVDDDPTVCMAIEVYLQRNSFRVTIAEGGEAGLRALEHEQFDLMITISSCRTCAGSNRSGSFTSGRRPFR